VEEPEQLWERIRGLLAGKLKSRFNIDPATQAQVLTPMQRGGLGARALNVEIQKLLNPAGESVERFGSTFRVGDRVMQTFNNYEKDVYNGDMGQIIALDPEEQELWVDMGGHRVSYRFSELDEIVLSYAVTIHKAQGSEYPCVILPLHTQHYMMLQRNLLYTGVTRGKKLVILVGSPKAISMAIRNADTNRRIGCLRQRLALG
jgi:exodeoxyribonuclease V alpha subunit